MPQEKTEVTLARGTSDKIAPATMRQWLYGLSIDPASAASMGLLAQAMVDAPRSLGKRTLGEGQGDFGGAALGHPSPSRTDPAALCETLLWRMS